MSCLHLLPLWQRLVEELAPIGINLATVHYDQEMELAQKLGGRRGELPHVVLAVESRITYYKDDQFSIIKVIGNFFMLQSFNLFDLISLFFTLLIFNILFA